MLIMKYSIIIFDFGKSIVRLGKAVGLLMARLQLIYLQSKHSVWVLFVYIFYQKE